MNERRPTRSLRRRPVRAGGRAARSRARHRRHPHRGAPDAAAAALVRPPQGASHAHPSRVAVGSPTLRLASILVVTLVLILAVVAAVVAGASLLPRPAPVQGVRNGLLAYDQQGDIWVVDPDASDPRPFVTDDTIDIDPTWSPDGRHLAFWALTETRPDLAITPLTISNAIMQSTAALVVVDDHGGHRQVLVDNVGLDWRGLPPSWQFDGRKLVYSGTVQGRRGVFFVDIVDPRGHKAEQPFEGGDAPTWSPDGTSVAYLGGTGDADAGVWVRDLRTEAERRVLKLPAARDSWASPCPSGPRTVAG